MPEIEIRNVLIDFPYEPYEIQKVYMSKVIECLQNKQNGVLESPTGTGKTLSLLCSSLAWLCAQRAAFQSSRVINASNSSDFTNKLEKDLCLQTGSSNPNWGNSLRPPKVVYASRTHSQLNQVMLELKKTSYRHLKVGVLGSRDQLCIHPQVSKETNGGAKIHMCKLLLSERKCSYYNNLEKKIQDSVFQDDRLIDIEDLLKKGKQMNCCPYYASRELQNDASVLFTPYNYLLDPKTRRAQDIKLHTDVVILDEGHNVEKVCEESSSTQLSSTTVAICIKDVTAVMKIFHQEATENAVENEVNTPKDFSEAELELLKTLFMEIEKGIDNIELPDKKPRTFPASHVFKILEAASITTQSVTALQDLLNKLGQFLMTVNDSHMHQKGAGLSKFSEFLDIVFNSLGPQRSPEYTDFNYKLYVEMEVVKTTKGNSWATSNPVDTGGKTLNFWCFNPGFGMRSLVDQGVHSIILTSGTLSPLAATISEIGIPVAVQLSNEHIIKPNQISAVVVDKGPRTTELRCVYQNRSNETYLADLGQTCLNFYKIIPGGVLVFFPSYPFLKACVEFWQQNGTWDRMAALKSIFIEPQTKDQMKSIMDEYYSMVNERGASLFAVCRGKISEGLDFADSRARAVMVIGLPYPPFNDPKVTLKREYLDNGKKKKLSTLDGNEWYQLEAMRAVNQAIGRVIRHANDHGAIIFCDCRFSYPSNIKTLSAWLQSHIVPNCAFGKALNLVSGFFRTWKDAPTKIFYDESRPFSSSSHPTSFVQPAQKLAPSSSAPKAIDYTKLYEKPEGTCDSKPGPMAGSVKRKSVLESLDEEDSISIVEEESKPVASSSKEPKESFVSQPTNPKKRKIAIVRSVGYDIDPEVKSDPKNFDIKKYTAKLQKKFTSEQLKIFRGALGEYYKSEDCNRCIAKLNELFLSRKDEDLLSLYRDIPNFLKTDEHKEHFWSSYTRAVSKMK